MKTLKRIAAFALAPVSILSTASAQIHTSGTFCIAPPEAQAGVEFPVMLTQANFDGNGDTHLWTRAEVEFRRADGSSVFSGNLITNGATFVLYFNGVAQGTRTVEDNVIELPGGGWVAAISVTSRGESADVGSLISVGRCEFVDLHEAVGGFPTLGFGSIEVRTEITAGIALRIVAVDDFVIVKFTQPAFTELVLQTSEETWEDAWYYPESPVPVDVTRTYPALGPQRFFRLMKP